MKDKTPLVSIIVPVYNAEEYLEECLDSILNQTYTNLEVILINDGSSDNSLNIIQEYAEKESRIIFFTIDNSGPGVCRNVGLDKFSGEFLMFIDSDDIICSDLVDVLINKLEDTSEMAMCKFSKDVNKISKGTKFVENQTSIFADSIKAIYRPGFASSGPCAKLYGKKIFSELRFPDITMYEDAAISLQVLSLASKITFVDYYGYYYRFNPESITNKKVSERNFAIIEKTRIVLDFVKTEHPEAFDSVKRICINDNDYVMIECVRDSSEVSNKLFDQLLQQNRDLSRGLGGRKLVYINRLALRVTLKIVGKVYYNDFIRNIFKKVLGI
ncbi:glycosyltransferase family 2 protein [Lactococcus kimchii]|uniref:glycosyltransferase family 2 protein n=1 Tax=Lactococcus sp. S-13 TaxID=2507158 RepID=UPI0010238016|nr:glycosyltransferase family A protein [Lactococcus sp. S-13]RZI49599.1 glycosyltransferase family 2 protein [Lactococcus sp. S-13]